MTMGVDTASDVVRRNPITGFVGCWARAASGHVAAAPPMSVINSRRLIGIPSCEDQTLSHCRKAVLCITACWPTRLPQRVISLGGDRARGTSLCPQYLRSRRNFMHAASGAGEHRRRHVKAERLGRLEIDRQLILH